MKPLYFLRQQCYFYAPGIVQKQVVTSWDVKIGKSSSSSSFILMSSAKPRLFMTSVSIHTIVSATLRNTVTRHSGQRYQMIFTLRRIHRVSGAIHCQPLLNPGAKHSYRSSAPHIARRLVPLGRRSGTKRSTRMLGADSRHVQQPCS